MIARISHTERLEGSVAAPSSKNYTTRYILVSCLANGISEVRHPADNDDAKALIECCRALGAEITEKDNSLLIRGFGNHPRNPGVLNPHNAGAVLRFLLGIGALLPEVNFITDYPDSLGKRPNEDLLKALEQLGVETDSDNGHLPITLKSGRLHGGNVRVSGAKSSQYVSSLLFLAPLIGKDVTIKVTEGLKSKPLIETTLEVLCKAGISLKAGRGLREFFIPGGQRYTTGTYEVNGDYPGASAILAAAAITRSNVTISRLFEDSQGERAALRVLRKMGTHIVHKNDSVTISSDGTLTGVEFNGDRATDAVLSMVAAACFAQGTSRFYNVENLRFKECDRISESLEELKKIGVRADEKHDEIIIHGSPEGYEGDIEVDAHNDHRVIMMLTIVGLGCKKGLNISNAHHVSKSYPDFFEDVQSIGAGVTLRHK